MENGATSPTTPNIIEHGVAAPVATAPWGPSTVATVDADGRRIVFTKLWTGGSSSYLFIDGETGESEQIYPEASGTGAYQILLTPDNIVYDTMGEHLVTIDVAARTQRRVGAIPPSMSLSFVRAESGIIYAGIYPDAVLVSHDPSTDTFLSHGSLNDASWPQYLRPLAIDASGWVYGGIAIQSAQVVGINPATGEKRTYIPDEKRQRGNPIVYLGTDGVVYAWADGWGWHILSEGAATVVSGEPPASEAEKGTDTFPDGSRLVGINIPDRKLSIQDLHADGPRTVKFDYDSPGIRIYTIAAGSDGKIHGATGIPLRVWQFDPSTGGLWNRGLGGYGGHINQFARQGDKLYGAVYSTGSLLEYDPALPYDDAPMETGTNPRQVHYADEARKLYGRPSAVLAHPDGRHILVGGSADRVIPGSGLLVYDIETEQGTILDRSQLIVDQGITAMAGLPDGDVLVGTTTLPPTGGSKGTAETALIYRLSLQDSKITARWPIEPSTPTVRDIVVARSGLVYALADPNRLLVLDPAAGAFLHDQEIAGYGNLSGYQAPRCMLEGPDGVLYALFREAVVKIDPEDLTHSAIARSDVPITTGIALLQDRLYFGCGSRLYSCAIDS